MSAPTWPNIPETIYIWTPNGTDWEILWLPFHVTEPVYEYHLSPAWVSVEERMPETPKESTGRGYLVFGKYGYFIGYYWNLKGRCEWQEHNGRDIPVTHWMPLPSPPTDAE